MTVAGDLVKNPGPQGHTTHTASAWLASFRAAPAARGSLVSEHKSQKHRFLQPVVRCHVFEKDVVIESAPLVTRPEAGAAKRGEIRELTWQALQRMRLRAVNTTTPWRSLITLTYPRLWQGNGEKVKTDLNAMLTHLRLRCGHLRYLWFLEFQKRGAPHFHILTDLELPQPRVGIWRNGKRAAEHCPTVTKWLLETWTATIGNRGCSSEYELRVEWEALRDAEGGARYVAKYACKAKQKIVPKEYWSVGRFWACDRATSKMERTTLELCADDLHAIVGDTGMGKHGTWHKVQFGAAEKFRALTKDLPSTSMGKRPSQRLTHAWDCVCPPCMQFQRKALATVPDGETLERWDGTIFRVLGAFYMRATPS
jgi:hypothetical protein